MAEGDIPILAAVPSGISLAQGFKGCGMKGLPAQLYRALRTPPPHNPTTMLTSEGPGLAPQLLLYRVRNHPLK